MRIEEFLQRLEGVKGPNASGEYLAKCPAHDDRTQSLCIREAEAENGGTKILIKCQTGRCSTREIVTAMNLQMKDLFDGTQGGKSGAGGGESFRKSAESGAKASSAEPKADKGKKTFVCAYTYRDKDGQTVFEACRYRYEDGSKTFLLRQPDQSARDGWRYSKEGVQLIPFQLPEVLRAIRRGDDVIICEGEKDCLTLANYGYTATTNPMGAGKWKDEYSTWLTGADVVLIPDNDEPGRKHMQMVAQSVSKTARSVRVADLTKVYPQLQAKGDATDLIEAAGGILGPQLIRQAIDQAAVYVPPDGEQQRLMDLYMQVPGYVVDAGRICKTVENGVKPLTNFVAEPVKIVTRDDGVNVSSEFVIRGWDQTGRKLPDARVKSDEYAGMTWVTKNWDFNAALMPGTTVKDQVRYAIGEVGRISAQHVTEYAHTGWRKIGGKWAYLYQGGAIGVDGVTVDLGTGLSAYRLDGNGSETYKGLTFRDGGQQTLRMIDAFAPHISVPLIGTLFLAPLREFMLESGCAPAYMLFLVGGTGTRKSTVMALGLSHFGNFTGHTLPSSYNDTANSIQRKAFFIKDMPFAVDDFHPSTSVQERKKMEQTAQALARAFGDGADRGRMKSDLSLQEKMPPRAVAIMSGEELPNIGESGLARYYVCEVHKDDIPLDDQLTDMQEKAREGYLQKSMAGYIKWLLQQLDEMPARLHKQWLNNRKLAREKMEQQHGRTAEAVAHIMLGYSMAMNYLRDIGVIDDAEAMRRVSEGWEIICSNSAEQTKEMHDDRPSAMFTAALRELMSTRAVGVRNLSEASDKQTEMGRDLVGYCDDKYYYFLPQVAYKAVNELYLKQGGTFPLQAKMLFKQLKEDGVLGPDSLGPGGKSTKPKRVGETIIRCLWIRKDRLNGTEGIPEDAVQVSLEDDPDNPW